MITIARCGSLDEALVLRSTLEGCGIAAFIPDELTAQMAPPYLFASLGHIRLQVAEDDAAQASAVLTQNGHELRV